LNSASCVAHAASPRVVSHVASACATLHAVFPRAYRGSSVAMQRSEQILAARGSDHPNKVSIGVRMLATPTATGGTTYPSHPLTPRPLRRPASVCGAAWFGCARAGAQCARNCAAASMRVSSMCSSRGRRGAAERRFGSRVVRV
jgi:hypothetical protein